MITRRSSEDSSSTRRDVSPGVTSEGYKASTPNEETQSTVTTTKDDIEKATSYKASEDARSADTTRAVDWDDRPENPRNWSWSKRIWQVLNTAIMGFLVAFASSVYTPAAPEIAERFHVSETASFLGLTLYTLGMGFGPVLGAPFSETLGRLVVFKLSMVLFMLFTLGAGFSQTFAALCACRFFAGLFGGPVLAVGAGTIADVLPPHIRGIGGASFLIAPFLGPALGPFIGGFVAQYEDWRWTQWVILFAAVPVFLVGFTASETYQKIIIKRLAKTQGKPIPAQGTTGKAAIKFLLTVTLIRPVTMLFTEPIVLAISAYTAFTFAVLFCFFAAFPIVFEGVYGFDTSQTGLTFLALGLGCILALITIVLVDRKYYYKKLYMRVKAEGGTMVAPEHRLYTAMLGSILVPIGLFWFAWTARKEVHWISPTLAAIPFAWGNLCIFVRLTSMFLLNEQSG